MTTLESTTERLENALEQLAHDAASMFRGLLSAGAELPFEIEPTDGDGRLAMYQYIPNTGDFIRSRGAELRGLESFLEVRELAGDEVAIGFLIGLWDGRTEFELTDSVLRGAMDGVLGSLPGRPGAQSAEGEVIVPLIGFHMPADEIELDGVRIARADSIDDAPSDAIDVTRAGHEGRPGFVAMVRCGLAGVAPPAAVADDLRRAIRTIRLFKAGSVGMASRGWVRRDAGWERFETGAQRPRNGGYRLTAFEATELAEFSKTLIERRERVPALAWAGSRFDLGSERSSLIEALSDYLLALRGLLEGGGDLRAGLQIRLGALVCEPHEREGARICVERALALERTLMSGGRFRPEGGYSPLEVISGLEELLRRLLKRIATGELDADLRQSADKILFGEGLTAGMTEATHASTDSSETAEWSIPDLSDDSIEVPEPAEGEITVRRFEFSASSSAALPEPGDDHGVRPSTPEPKIGENKEKIGGTMPASPHDNDRQLSQDSEHELGQDGEHRLGESRAASPRPDWFAAEQGETVEWPAFATPRRDHEGDRARASERVRHLFPVPDETDWNVGELRYERKRRPA